MNKRKQITKIVKDAGLTIDFLKYERSREYIYNDSYDSSTWILKIKEFDFCLQEWTEDIIDVLNEEIEIYQEDKNQEVFE